MTMLVGHLLTMSVFQARMESGWWNGKDLDVIMAWRTVGWNLPRGTEEYQDSNWASPEYKSTALLLDYVVEVQIVTVEFAGDLGSCLRNETPKEWQPVERRSSSDRDSCFWQNLYVLQWQALQMLRDSTHNVQVRCILLSKKHQLWRVFRY
jgi:hypothetical protein